MRKTETENMSKLNYIEKMPATPERRDRRLTFVKFIPARIMEKAMNKNLVKLRSGGTQGVNIAGREITITEFNIPGYNGEIKLKFYSPDTKRVRPLTVFFHGGAFIGGAMEGANNYCIYYADLMDEAVLSVEYHLAPEFPFPHGLEDCYLACKWACENASTLNVDTTKFTISGDSAGGNFAAVITLMAKERQDFTIDNVILLYPYVTFESPKLAMTRIMHKWYLAGADRSDFRVSPFNGDLKGFPRTLTVICEYDMLAKSGKNFAEKLAENGVDSTCLMIKKTRHAFIDKIGNLKQTEELLEFIKNWRRN